MLVLGLDLETTGLNTEECDIIEMGLVVWDTETNTPLRLLSELIQPRFDTEFPAFITELTGISEDHARTASLVSDEAIRMFMDCALECKYIVAHNGLGFDKPVLKKLFERSEKYKGMFPDEIPWIDTMIDISYPAKMRSRSLAHLAVDHGVTVLPSHRAVFDVLMMLGVAEKYSWEGLAIKADQPVVKKIAMNVNFHNKDLAKDAGFYWDAAEKVWAKVERDSEQAYPFEVKKIPR